MPWDFRKDGKMNLYGDSRRCSDIAYPNTCCHNVLLLTRRGGNLAYHVPHLLASQLDIICLFFFLFHIKSILVSQFQLILHLVDEDTSSLLGLLEFEQIAYYHAENKQEIYSFIFPYLNSYYYLALLFSPFPSYTLH